MDKKIKTIIYILIVVILLIGVFFITRLIFNKSYNKNNEKGSISGINYKIYQNYNLGSYDYSKRGYYVDTINMPDAPYYYIITMGRCGSGGYNIEITDIKIDDKKNVKVTVKETKPKAGENVTMSFTYPACCLELSKMANTITIKNAEGEVFNKLN